MNLIRRISMAFAAVATITAIAAPAANAAAPADSWASGQITSMKDVWCC